MRNLPNISVLLIIAILASGCGTVEPQSDDVVVIEGFLSPFSPTVDLRVRHSQSVWGQMTSGNPVDDADVVVMIGDRELRLEPEGGGTYSAALVETVLPGTPVRVDVRWRNFLATAGTSLPHPITIDSVSITPAPRPVEAVLIDSLQIGVTPPVTGWLYLVDVSIYWSEDAASEETFVRARLLPERSFVGPVVDFFLRSDHIFTESSADIVNDMRRWQGVYAVLVDSADDLLPEHELSVALLRSGHDYARYAASRTAPERREPAGNVVGGIGIVAGVAVDSLRLVIR